MVYLGNKDLLKIQKTGFLCSRKCPAEIVLKSYDWAKEQRAKGNCIVCGNHSQIEKDVFDILLRGSQPLILVLARGMKKRWESTIINAIFENRLLIISPFNTETKRVTQKLAEKRNIYILNSCDSIYVPYMHKNGMLMKMITEKK